MRYVDEYRGRDEALACARAIAEAATRPWRIMEVCGGQTHAIARFGLEELLPPGPTGIELLHGPGCPVCVTPAEVLDRAIALARRPEVVLCSYGDMLRVPGSATDLRTAKAEGADVRVVYSALDALALARALPDREVVFLAIGFETTAPGHALAAHQARREGVRNFSLLVSHVLVPPALEAILGDPDHRVDGFLAAGHVCTIMGAAEYEPVADRHRVPIVITGFEPVDILHGLLLCVRQLEAGRAEVENAYARAVRPGGNPGAQAMIREVFARRDQRWRGIGEIPASGLALAPAYADLDADRRFAPAPGERPPGEAAPAAEPDRGCRSGLVLVGKLKPPQCPAFGTRCTPERPLGATMVSSEGACAAYYRHRRGVP
ncbi:MAG TPA: hydrogenase formation protein HypD [Kofleriaceae bacterium]|nr:hydrogenase formation protein HypD [Kofleriaceae bacterium]